MSKGTSMAESTSPRFTRIGNYLGWLHNDQFYPIDGVSGGSDDGADSEGDGAGGDEAESSVSNKLSQDEVSKIAAREKREGKRAGAREVLSELGFEDADDAKQFIESVRAQQEAAKDEQTREREAAAEALAKGEAASQTAARVTHEANVLKGLLKTGADAETADELIPMVQAQVGADTEDIAEAISSLKTKFPALFESSTGPAEDESDETGGGTPDSNPGKARSANKPKGTAQERAIARLHERHPDLAKAE